MSKRTTETPEIYSFIMYQRYREIVNLLTDSEAGELIKAILLYEDKGYTTPLEGTTMKVFNVIREDLDRNRAKYIEKLKEK